MKLTWFGGTTIRIYIGGQIFVVDPQLAPDDIDRAEAVSGADRVLRLAGADEALAGSILLNGGRGGRSGQSMRSRRRRRSMPIASGPARCWSMPLASRRWCC